MPNPQNKDERIVYLMHLINTERKENDEKIKGLEEDIHSLKIKLGEFQGSVTYPLYRITSAIGRSFRK
jgi:hypothetical protein